MEGMGVKISVSDGGPPIYRDIRTHHISPVPDTSPTLTCTRDFRSVLFRLTVLPHTPKVQFLVQKP